MFVVTACCHNVHLDPPSNCVSELQESLSGIESRYLLDKTTLLYVLLTSDFCAQMCCVVQPRINHYAQDDEQTGSPKDGHRFRAESVGSDRGTCKMYGDVVYDSAI